MIFGRILGAQPYGPDDFLSLRTSGRRKNLGQNGLSGRPFFLSGQVGAGCRCNPITRLQIFPGIFYEISV